MKHPKCHLLFHTPTGKIRYPLNNNGGNTLGRKSGLNPPDVDLLIETTDNLMSRRHARISISFGMPPNYLLSDLDSQNGTVLINKQRQELTIMPGDEVFLEDGYIIRMGATEVVFEMVRPDSKTNLRV